MNFNSLFIKSIRTRSQLYNYQTVRWRKSRKPFWLGLAKSKMFKVPERKKFRPDEEVALIRTLQRHYRTNVKSMMNFIKVDNPNLKEIVVEEEGEMSEALEKKVLESLETNESWNNESARRRNERMKSGMESEMEKAIRELDIREEKRIKQMEIIEEIVRKEKVLSGSYITPENLDAAIEDCLNKVECFDFAIDTEGNKYPGRESLPPNLQSQKKDIIVESPH